MLEALSVPSEWWQYPPWLASVAKQSSFLRVGSNIIYRRVTASTNDDARNLAKEGAPDGLVVLADEQTHGRGRLGRSWFAPPDTCLLLSVLFRSPLALEKAGQLAMIMGLAALDAISESTGLKASLKWPNDVFLSEKKAGGILSEIESDGRRLRWAVVGLGLNVNVSFDGLPEFMDKAISLKSALGRDVDRGSVLAVLLRSLSVRYARLLDGEDPAGEWQSHLHTIGKRVTAHIGNEVILGRAEMVTTSGSLLLHRDDGSWYEVSAGDVKLRQEEAEV